MRLTTRAKHHDSDSDDEDSRSAKSAHVSSELEELAALEACQDRGRVAPLNFEPKQAVDGSAVPPRRRVAATAVRHAALCVQQQSAAWVHCKCQHQKEDA